MTTQLKYEHIEPGTKIRAYDFQPMEGRSDRYIEGVVRRHEMNEQGWFLIVRCDHDAAEGMSREGNEVYVPMETDMEDTWMTPRVVVLATKAMLHNIRADRRIRELLEGTGFTYGYIGNVWNNSLGDDRGWFISKPHPGRPGTNDDQVGMTYNTDERYKLCVVAAAIRAGYDVAKQEQ